MNEQLPNDVHIDELMPQMNVILEEFPNSLLYLKWTCPTCGERATAETANTYHTDGYVHADCGGWYHGKYFGFMAVLKGADDDPDH
jgi:hypothetical protein